MNEKSLRVLEYFKIIEKLTSEATSTLGKTLCEQMRPSVDPDEISNGIAETTEAVELLLKFSAPPFGPILDLKNHIKIAEIGSFMSTIQLLQVSDTLRTGRNLKSYLLKSIADSTAFPILKGLAEQLTAIKSVEDAINNAIIGENQISDNASPALRKIRREIESKHQSVKSKLEHLVRDQESKKYLQDSLVTIREDRFVVPVKSEYKAMIKGLVHDRSSSGSTLYIEPFAVVELNNELRELKLKEQAEIERILTELTAFVGEYTESIRTNQEILQVLDFIFAKGKLALSMKAVEPEINKEGKVRLKNGRHPLLDPKNVVPSNFWIGEQFKTLLITGPNTGGKTVTLKTVGLLTLMMQSGLHVPADYGTKMAIFDGVFADIGDEQSIEQSLSTFSSHMTNIVEIMNHASKNSLVLFDELGAGTDPTEGAALAKAILDKLYKWHVTTIATTHYSELKEYALLTEGVENGSVEFDVNTLSPTYRLLIGVPGKSNAFEISRKLGLSGEIIEEAKKMIATEDIVFEEILANIEKSRKAADEERDLAIRLRLESEQLKKKLAEREDKLSAQKEKILEQAKEEARKVLKEAKEQADELAKEIRQIGTDVKKTDSKRVEEMRRKIKTDLDALNALQTEEEDYVYSNVPKNLKIGDSVKVISLNQIGTVSTLPDKNGDLNIQVGIMNLNINVSQLKLAEAFSEKKPQKQKSASSGLRTASVKSEVDLRGMNVEEAIVVLDKYLDEAYLSHLQSVRVIHGIGTGALKAGLQQFFRNHHHIKSFRLGAYGEGGMGVTVIELK